MLQRYTAPPLPFDFPDEFSFDQLSESAKERARESYREHATDHDWWLNTYEDADKIADMLGITISSTPVRLHGGGTRHDPDILFSGFWSQGDGACLQGGWSPVDNPMEIIDQVLAYAPEDDRLHRIAADLAELSERHGRNSPENGTTHVRIAHRGHYYHSGCAQFEFTSDGPEGSEDWNELQLMTWHAVQRARGMDTWEHEVIAALRAFMDWIYRQLEQEYEYLTSDEVIDEYLAEKEFDEDGNII